MPFVTGVTWWYVKDGNITIEPLGLISIISLNLFTPACGPKSNFKLPPSYSPGKFKLIVKLIVQTIPNID